jgi:hypothetical protein
MSDSVSDSVSDSHSLSSSLHNPALEPVSQTELPTGIPLALWQEKIRSPLQELLEQEGFVVLSVQSLDQLEGCLTQHTTLAVVLGMVVQSELDLGYPKLKTEGRLEGRTFVAIFGPAARMLGRERDMQLPATTRPHEVLRFLRNLIDNPQTAPQNTKAAAPLRSSVRTQAAPELNGTLEFFSLFELMTLLGGSNKSGILHLHWDDLGARILVEDGQIRHAQWDNTTGEAALSKIFLEAHRYPEGRFFFEDFLEGTPKEWQGVLSITAPTDKVLFHMAVTVAQQED